MLSISRSKGFSGSQHSRFETLKYRPSIEKFTELITQNVWSPIVWKDGRRLSKNFLSCSYFVLDFDSGEWTIEKTINWCEENDYAAIIGTTKSHQKEKISDAGLVQRACDRFRLVIPFDSTISDRDLYNHQLKTACKRIPSDSSCTDAARFFYPCKEVVFSRHGGRWKVESIEGSETERIKQVAAEKRKSGFYEKAARYGLVPPGLAWVLRNSLPPGGRRSALYRYSAEAARFGIDASRWIKIVLESKLVRDLRHDTGISDDEIKRQVLNGYNAK